MIERFLRISNGKLVRSGLYRGKQDPEAQRYKEQVATGAVDTDCVFCEESIKRRTVEIIDKIGSKVLGLSLTKDFYVIQATPAYAHFEGQQVLDHKLIIPYEHVTSEHDLSRRRRCKLGRYIYEMERAAELRQDGTFVQGFTRSKDNMSKSVAHLHTHALTLSPNPVTKLAYDIDEGVQELEFAELTPEQIAEVVKSRQVL